MISLVKKEQITFRLSEFILSVYGKDLDQIADRDHFYFDHYILNKDVERNHSDKIMQLYNLTKEDSLELTRHAMIYKNETSYIDDYMDSYKGNFETKITQDFKNIYKINSNDEKFQFEEIPIKEINYDKNIITFDTTFDNFAKMLISIINDCGYFGYDSVEEFYEAYPANTTKDKTIWLKNNLGSLSSYEDINGTIYDIFTFNDTHMDDDIYGTYEITEDELKQFIEDYGTDI